MRYLSSVCTPVSDVVVAGCGVGPGVRLKPSGPQMCFLNTYLCDHHFGVLEASLPHGFEFFFPAPREWSGLSQG